MPPRPPQRGETLFFPLIDCPEFALNKKWRITVQTPEASLDQLISAVQENIELLQGAYSHCMFIRKSGATRFKNEAGAHGGAEAVVREVSSAEVVLVIPYDMALLEQAIRCIAWAHVHEEPTISVADTWEYLAGPQHNRNNPNRYWNREDRDEIHGAPSGRGVVSTS